MLDRFNVLDVFAGGGFMSDAFRQAGFTIVAGVDNFPEAVATFSKNFPDATMYGGDIEDRAFVDGIVTDLKGKIDVVIGGPPCGSYSTAGNRDPLEHRAYYFLRFFDVVKRIGPEAFVFENVPGIKSMRIIDPELIDSDLNPTDDDLAGKLRDIRRFKDLTRYGRQRALAPLEIQELEDLVSRRESDLAIVESRLVNLLERVYIAAKDAGYDLVDAILDSKLYGSAQSRKRYFLVGVRRGSMPFSFPGGFLRCLDCDANVVPTAKGECPESASHSLAFKTPLEAIGDLIGKQEGFIVNHVFTKHSPGFIKRIHGVKQGECLYKTFNDAWYRLRPGTPSRSCKESHNASFLHFSEDRVVTPREMMRIVSARDEFVLVGSKTKIIKLIGNCVDGSVGRAIATSLKEWIERKRRESEHP